jgi:hypothetical protein
VAQLVAQILEAPLDADTVGLQFENLGAAARVERLQLWQLDGAPARASSSRVSIFSSMRK